MSDVTSSDFRFLGDVRDGGFAAGLLFVAIRLRRASNSAPIVLTCSPIVLSMTACITSSILHWFSGNSAFSDASSSGSGVISRSGPLLPCALVVLAWSVPSSSSSSVEFSCSNGRPLPIRRHTPRLAPSHLLGQHVVVALLLWDDGARICAPPAALFFQP